MPLDGASAGLDTLGMYWGWTPWMWSASRRKEWMWRKTWLVSLLWWHPLCQPSTTPVLSPCMRKWLWLEGMVLRRQMSSSKLNALAQLMSHWTPCMLCQSGCSFHACQLLPMTIGNSTGHPWVSTNRPAPLPDRNPSLCWGSGLIQEYAKNDLQTYPQRVHLWVSYFQGNTMAWWQQHYSRLMAPTLKLFMFHILRQFHYSFHILVLDQI